MDLTDTLGNQEWLKDNEEKIKELLPETWTHMANLDGMKLGFQLKVLGIEWHGEEFGQVMLFLEKIGFMLREDLKVRRNPNTIFKG